MRLVFEQDSDSIPILLDISGTVKGKLFFFFFFFFFLACQ